MAQGLLGKIPSRARTTPGHEADRAARTCCRRNTASAPVSTPPPCRQPPHATLCATIACLIPHGHDQREKPIPLSPTPRSSASAPHCIKHRQADDDHRLKPPGLRPSTRKVLNRARVLLEPLAIARPKQPSRLLSAASTVVSSASPTASGHPLAPQTLP
jgi:hypothetical protein